VPDTAGYILVGGKSSRLGRDKALIELEGRPLVHRMAEIVCAAAGSAALIGPPEKYGHLGWRVIPDSITDFGPLGGLLAALDDSERGWNLVTACDMPNLTEAFLRFLLEQAHRSSVDILLPLDAVGRAEPLCAVYSLQCRETIRGAVGCGIHKMTDAFMDLRVRELRPRDYAEFDPDGCLFANLNTPEDWKRV
jgi:molybdopterin-guanine dinucleotide biosynthesis protein A